MDRRYLTRDLEPLGGTLKAEPRDFLVEEVGLYEPSGVGDHLYLRIEKEGIGTFEAIDRLARALGRRPREFGYAGLKDAHAVARQTLSLEHVDAARVARLAVPGLRILEARRHGNKLRIGHLRGNRFRIRLRGVTEGDEERARRALDVLARRGVPNYFGAQRFGAAGNGAQLGEALVRRDATRFVDLLLGIPGPGDPPRVAEAKRAFGRGQMGEARRTMPAGRPEAGLLHDLTVRKLPPSRAIARVPRRLLRLFLSAFQARLFHAVLDERIDELDRVEEGDVAVLHRNGAAFLVHDVPEEAPRVARFEISPSGPLFGRSLLRAESRPGRLEEDVLAAAGLEPSLLEAKGPFALSGGRRALRFPLRDVTVKREAEDLILGFFLPRGCYATAVVAELWKRDPAARRAVTARVEPPETAS